MRKKIKIYRALVCLSIFCISCLSLMAKEETVVEKTKIITRSYPISSTDKISLSNQFGDIKLVTWDKPEISITVTIIAKTQMDKRAQEIFNNINIISAKDGKGINCITHIENNVAALKNSAKNEAYAINYLVYLPADNALSISNDFGAVIIPDYTGETDITSRHGSLSTGRLHNAREITVEFGTAELFHINNGHIVLKYARANIYQLSGNIDATFESVDSIRLTMNNSIKTLHITNSYSKIYLDFGGKFSGKFVVTGQMNEVSAAPGNKMTEELLKPVSDPPYHRYTVIAGSGEREITVNSRFGKVILGNSYAYQKTIIKTTNKIIIQHD